MCGADMTKTEELLALANDMQDWANDAPPLRFVPVSPSTLCKASAALREYAATMTLTQDQIMECDALRADAERYRFLRDNRFDENDEGEKYITFFCDFEHYDDVDAAIDAARSTK